MAARTAWLRARALLALGRQREGLRILGQHAGGRSADAAACRFLLATSLDQSDQDREALEEFAGYARDHADGKNLDAALWRAGWLSFRFRRYAESERLFRRLLDRPNGAPYHPSSRYWLARALEARGLRGVAVDLYRRILREHTRDYYGLRSKERLRSLGAAGPAAADGHGAPPGAAAGPDDPPETLGRPSQEFCAKPRPGRAQDRVLTGCELETVGLFQDAEIEYRAAAEADPDRALALRLAELALRRGDRAGATERLKAAVPDHLSVPTGSLPMRYWELLYPLRERDKIDEMARARRLEPNLVCALILQESAFNPLAVSKAGAMGLMQILPETGREAAAAIDERGFSPARLLEPSTNVRLGTWHFAEILRRCEGRIELALAAYTAGEGRLRTWRRRYDTSDPSVFVEEIPFTETRLYVKRILSHAAMYRELYERRPG
jgi:soluble lytic murein transglycosylase